MFLTQIELSLKEISINRPYSFTRIENDTIAITYLDTISSGEDISNFSSDPVDTVYKAFTINDSATTKKAYYVYRLYKNEFQNRYTDVYRNSRYYPKL